MPPVAGAGVIGPQHRYARANYESSNRAQAGPSRTWLYVRTLHDTALRRGVPTAGFPTDVWTVPRVAQIIARLTGEQFHPSHVWRLLRALGWSVQRPARQAREHDEGAIQR